MAFVLMALSASTVGVAAADGPSADCSSEGLDTVYVLGPSDQLITIHSDPTDPDWETAMTQAVGIDLANLERLTGTPMPLEELIVVQSSATLPLGQEGDFRRSGICLLVHDEIERGATPAVALARTWFNASTVSDPWLAEGLAMWAGHRVTGARCPQDTPASSQCSIIETIADRIGPYRMLSVVNAFLIGAPVYGDGPAIGPDEGPIGWRAFLDAVDELGLVRAGEPDLEWAERLLVEAGVIGAADVEGRAEARLDYHRALDGRGAAALPAEVDDLMGAWRFDEARQLIAEATAAP